jgi:hypothetical protein
MATKILWLSGSAIFLVLGIVHLYYTFFTNKFDARNKTVILEMKNTSPVLTGETTMWNAWIGFNASHSAGAIFFGIINILLTTQYFPILQNSVPIILLNIVTVLFYCWLGKKYWFRIPFTGVLIAAGCFIAATAIFCFG